MVNYLKLLFGLFLYLPIACGTFGIKNQTEDEWNLVWADEFNNNGKPDSTNWKYEHGFVRNNELQWYQPEYAYCKDGFLIIEGRRERISNPRYAAESNDWRRNREFADYTSASLLTHGLREWQYGRLEVRARIDTSQGAWPAIWTLGVNGPWPENGEVDVMEYYQIENKPHILANVAWGTEKKWTPVWNSAKIPYSKLTAIDPDWHKKFHTWRMDWDVHSIQLFLDGELLNSQKLSETINADGTNPFHQPHYLILNLAIGSNGGNPSQTQFPIKYEIDYVRLYQKKNISR